MLFGCRASLEGAEVSPPPGVRIGLARVQPILAGFQLADHALSRVAIIINQLQDKHRRKTRAAAVRGPPDGIGYNARYPDARPTGVAASGSCGAHGTGESGGTGRRAGLRIPWGNPWEVGSLLSHQFSLASLRYGRWQRGSRS